MTPRGEETRPRMSGDKGVFSNFSPLTAGHMGDALSERGKAAHSGWSVFPLHTPTREGGCDCRKPTCENQGKHPRTKHGVSDATTDEAQIRKWWTMWPNANIGVACGPSGLVVLDVDPRHGGDESLRDLCETHGNAWLNTGRSITGGGGQHYLYRAPDVPKIRNSSGVLGPGLDIRGDGGYFIIPPSRHVSGKLYEWEVGPGEGDLLEFPSFLVKLLAQSTKAAPSTEPGSPIIEGQRDGTLTSLAGMMRRRGFSPASILAALREENRLRCQPPLPDGDVQRITRSVSRYPEGRDVQVRTGATEYANLRRWSVTPPIYWLEVNGTDVQLSRSNLFRFTELRGAIFEQHNWLAPIMTQEDWGTKLQDLVDDMRIEDAAPDASPAGFIWSVLCELFPARASSDEARWPVMPVLRKGVVHANARILEQMFSRLNLKWDSVMTLQVIRSHGGTSGSARIKGNVTKTWQIPVSALEEEALEGEFAVTNVTDLDSM